MVTNDAHWVFLLCSRGKNKNTGSLADLIIIQLANLGGSNNQSGIISIYITCKILCFAINSSQVFLQSFG